MGQVTWFKKVLHLQHLSVSRGGPVLCFGGGGCVGSPGDPGGFFLRVRGFQR